MSKGGARPGAGRKKGHKASHTIEALNAKAALIRRFVAEQEPIFKALLTQAKRGNIKAIRELFERVWGKETEKFDMNAQVTHTFDVTDELYKAILSRESQRNSPQNRRAK
jgi:thioredoxin-like negative regulator of GroEL